ncbi:MAG TPA: hypothetical protein PK263_02865 [bacterium]|nr:hypothetical protein [bacterium]
MDEIKLKREKSAKFYCGDLHVHSCLSFEAPKSIELDGKRIALDNPENFVRVIADKEVDIIALTDHMTVRETLDYCAKLPKGKFLFLPGIEMNVRFKDSTNKRSWHLLFIASEIFCDAIATQMLGETNLNPNFPTVNDLDESTYKNYYFDFDGFENFKKFLSKYSKYGIFLFAHTNSNNGFRGYFEGDKDGILETETDRKNFAYERIAEIPHLIVGSQLPVVAHEYKDKVIGKFVASDAHTPEEIGSKASYYKMTSPSYEGVKKAFSFYKTRISYEKGKPKYPKILGLKFNGGFLNGQTLGFSDDLTSIIGGRGSGKTTVLEGLRIVFGKNKELFKLLEKRGKKVHTIKDDRALGLQNSSLQNTTIEVLFQTEQDVYLLTSVVPPIKLDKPSLDPVDLLDIQTKIFNLKDEPQNLKIENTQFRIDFFGWSEIESMGLDKKEQIGLIDNYVDFEELQTLRLKVIGLETDLSSETVGCNADAIIEKITSLNEKFAQLKNYFYFKHEYKELSSKNPEFLTKYEKLSSERRIYDNLREEASKLFQEIPDETTIEKVISLLNQEEIDKNLIPEKDITELKGKKVSYTESVKKIINSIDKKIGGIDAEFASLEKSLREDATEGDSEQTNQIEQFLDLTSKWKKQETLYLSYESEKSELAKLVKERFAKLQEAENLQNELTELRKQAIDKITDRLKPFLSSDFSIQISLNVLAPEISSQISFSKLNDLYIFFLREEFLSTDIHSKYKSINLAEKIAHNNESVLSLCSLLFNLEELGISTKKTKNFIEAKTPQDKEINEKISEQRCLIREEISDYKQKSDSERIFNFNQGVFDEMTKKISPFMVDDKIDILFGSRPIENSSPGQRVSAILPIIFLAGNSPLIIDQPEDNLDNNHIKTKIVDILSELKIQRQIIIATHNANIVVLGDSEQVVVMEADDNNQGQIKFEGFIDDEKIVESVISLLEGGKEAFKDRRDFYNMHKLI